MKSTLLQRLGTAVILLVGLVLRPAGATEPSIRHGAAEMATATKNHTRSAAHRTARGVKRAARATGRTAKRGAKATARGTGRVLQKTGGAVDHAGERLEDVGR
jgi:type IV secretory pathway TrbL component